MGGISGFRNTRTRTPDCSACKACTCGVSNGYWEDTNEVLRCGSQGPQEWYRLQRRPTMAKTEVSSWAAAWCTIVYELDNLS